MTFVSMEWRQTSVMVCQNFGIDWPDSSLRLSHYIYHETNSRLLIVLLVFEILRLRKASCRVLLYTASSYILGSRSSHLTNGLLHSL